VEAVGSAFGPDAWSRRVGGGLAAAAELRAAGVEPADPRAAAAVAAMAGGFAELMGRRDGPAFRRWLVAQLDAHTDPRAERYWSWSASSRAGPGRSSPAWWPTTPG
jgi:hypothetical protein